MVIDFSKVNLKEKPVLVLKNLDGTAIQTLGFAFEVSADLSYNEISTLNFELPSQINGVPTPHYDDVVGMRIIDLVDYGQFILIDPKEKSEDVKKTKICTAYSLEYEFTKKKITLENGTYNFWNPLAPEDTILGRILEVMPDWSIGEVDNDLIGKYRTFEVIDDKAYDFIKNDVQETYKCIFEFDTYNRVINIKSANSDIEVKQIYLSKERLIKEIEIEESSDSIVTCLDVNGAEGVSIRSVNPTGTNKIYNLDYFMNTTNFTEEFIEKWRHWEQTYESYQSIYYNTTIEYNLKTACKLTKQAALVDLQGELTTLENEQAVVVQAISQKLEPKYTLTEIKEKIYNKKEEIADMKAQITDIDTELSELHEKLSNINDMLAFDRSTDDAYVFFTPEELSVLKKYFIEDSIQDETFVAATATTYENEDISNSVNSVELTITESDIEIISDSNGKILRTISGGSLNIGTLTANIIKATIEFNDDDTFVMTMYLDNGVVGETSFTSGNVSLIGEYKIISSNNHKLSFMIYNGTLYFTKNTTDFEQHAIEWELYEYGKEVLKELSEPIYNFSVDSGNFLTLDDFISFKNELELGRKLYLKLDDNEPLMPYVVDVSIDFEDLSSFSLNFSSSYTKSNKFFSIDSMLEESVSMGKKLNVKSNVYNEFVNSGASTRVKSFMESALDVAKNTVLSSGNQAIEFGDAGIRVRKWADDEHTSYDDEQIWIVDNMIAFTTDNWSTASMAIGKIYDANLGTYTPATSEYDPEKIYYYRVGDREPYTYVHYIYSEDTWNIAYPSLYYKSGGYSYGIAAPYLVGTIIAGENLTIDTKNGAFRVDESGVYIDSLKFYITHNGSSYDTTLGEEFEALQAATDKVANDMNDAIQEINEEIARTVTTYYQEKMPDDAHEGDLWYTIGTSHEYMFRNIKEGDSVKGFDYDRTTQPECTVEEVVIALSDGTTYSSTSDGKLIDNRGEIIYADGIWTEFSYGIVVSMGSNYPTAITVNVENPFYSAILGDCYTEFIAGKLFRYDGRSWDEIIDKDIIIAIENAANAQATADSKIVSYYQNFEPYKPTIGDIWYNTAESNSVTRHIEVGDNLSQKTLYFDKSNFPTSYSCSENELVIETSDEKYNAGIYVNTVPNRLVVRQGGTYSQVYDYSTSSLIRESMTLSSSFGIVADVDKNSPFYAGITATFTNSYIPKKLYRYDGYKWVLVEDGEISTIKNEVSENTKTIAKFITEDKNYLNATKLNGVIDSTNAQMQSAAGNVLFDSDGIWLLNKTTKSSSTKAIWMNENGMLFGSGTATENPATSEDWTWTTAITHDGITADALAGKYLSGCEIYGGYLNINNNFIVSRTGVLTAEQGIFKGTVQASDFKDEADNSMMSNYKFTSDYLSLYGLEILNDSDEQTLYIDSDGNITMKGSITLGAGSKIQWANIDETDSSAYKTANSAYDYADDAYDYADDAYSYASSAYTRASNARTLAQNIANGKYSGGTFIDGTSIYAPEIYSNEFNVFPENDGDNEGSFNLYAYYGSSLYHFLRIHYYESTAPMIIFDSPSNGYAYWNFPVTEFSGNIDFSDATVTGITAKFG